MDTRSAAVVAVISLLLVLPLCAGSFGHCPPTANVTVDPRDAYRMGLDVGLMFSGRIQEAIDGNAALRCKYLPWIETMWGRRVVTLFLRNTELYYPDEVLELRGIADGAALPFESLFLVNIEMELRNIIPESMNVCSEEEAVRARPVEHCSDVAVNNPDEFVLGHNEDGDLMTKPTSYMTGVTSLDPSVPSFMSYTYAGQLAGNAYSWNSAGLVFTINALYADRHMMGGVGIYFIMRSMLRARTLDEAIGACNRTLVPAGFSVNIASWKEQRVVNVEVGLGNYHVSVRELHVGEDSSMYHFNSYLRLDEADSPSPSSAHREARWKEMSPFRTANDIRQFLGDTADKEFPVYRSGTPPDGGATAATILFDLKRARADLFCENPKAAASDVIDLAKW